MNLPAILFVLIKYSLYIAVIVGWVWGIMLIVNAYRKRRKRFWVVKQKYTTLLIQVPRNNEKGPLSAQLMFASLHGIYKTAQEHLQEGSFQEHLSFEIVSQAKYIKFYIYVPSHLREFVEGQVYSQYPTVEMQIVDDYTVAKRREGVHFAGTELKLTKKDCYPIKTFVNFEVDPLAGITGVLSQVEGDEQIWTQILVRPVDDSWQKSSIDYVKALKAGKKPSGTNKVLNFIGTVGRLMWEPPSYGGAPSKENKLAGPVEQAAKAIEEKSTKLGYEVKIRLALISSRAPEEMKIKVQSIVGGFKQFNASNLNGFTHGGVRLDDFEFMNDFQTRNFQSDGYILNIEELASIYHLPTLTVETPSIVWAGAKKGEPPATLPTEENTPSLELTTLGVTNFRNSTVKFGIKMEDRLRHMYIVGQTGTGKSTFMENMVIDDIREGRGVAVIDPHGSFVDNVINHIPSSRIQDVVLLNPGDREYSLGFNLLESVDPDKRELLASGLMSIFMKIWEGVWSARMEHIMKNIILALLETPGSTLLGTTKLLLNAQYRKMIVDNITDPIVKEYWTEEFESQVKTNPKFLTEAIAPIQNKVGKFLAVPSVRNIIGQPKSTFDISEIINNKKILLVKISKGEIGDDNMALLGAMIVAKIQLAIMERSGMNSKDMNPFFLYVDEFQNFATSSFATILSEARKYKLSLIVAHQYMRQLSDEIRDAVVGNTGTIVAFRVGADDGPVLKSIFEPVFDDNDLVNLSNFQIYLKLMIDNSVHPAFSAKTIKPPETPPDGSNKDAIIEHSREHYAVRRDIVEKAILDWSTQMAELNESALGNSNGDEYKEKKAPAVGEGYREFKDKNGGAWYVKEDPEQKEKEEKQEEKIEKMEEKDISTIVETSGEGIESQPIENKERDGKTVVSNSDQDNSGHEKIIDIPIAKNEIAEEAVATKPSSNNGGHINPGESIEL